MATENTNAPDRHRPFTKVAADRIGHYIRGNRFLFFFASQGARSATESRFAPVRKVLGPLRNRLRGGMSAGDVLSVAGALQNAAIRFWVAGGWGVDALLREQTRSHQDLDIVIDDYERHEAAARAALEALGYRLFETRTHETWMPLCTALDDGVGHRIELLSVDRDLLVAKMGWGARPSGEPGKPRDSIADELPDLFTMGEIDGRPIPCLSAPVQLLYHSGYDLKPELQRDVARLEAAFGRLQTASGSSS